jgi:hypothetical protein
MLSIRWIYLRLAVAEQMGTDWDNGGSPVVHELWNPVNMVEKDPSKCGLEHFHADCAACQ